MLFWGSSLNDPLKPPSSDNTVLLRLAPSSDPESSPRSLVTFSQMDTSHGIRQKSVYKELILFDHIYSQLTSFNTKQIKMKSWC